MLEKIRIQLLGLRLFRALSHNLDIYTKQNQIMFQIAYETYGKRFGHKNLHKIFVENKFNPKKNKLKDLSAMASKLIDLFIKYQEKQGVNLTEGDKKIVIKRKDKKLP